MKLKFEVIDISIIENITIEKSRIFQESLKQELQFKANPILIDFITNSVMKIALNIISRTPKVIAI